MCVYMCVYIVIVNTNMYTRCHEYMYTVQSNLNTPDQWRHKYFVRKGEYLKHRPNHTVKIQKLNFNFKTF